MKLPHTYGDSKLIFCCKTENEMKKKAIAAKIHIRA